MIGSWILPSATTTQEAENFIYEYIHKEDDNKKNNANKHGKPLPYKNIAHKPEAKFVACPFNKLKVAQCYLILGDIKRAKYYLTKISNREKESLDVLALYNEIRINALVLEGKDDDVKFYILQREGYRTNPHHMIALARISHKQKFSTLCNNLLDEIIKLRNLNAKQHLQLASLLMHQKRCHEALSYLLILTEHNGNNHIIDENWLLLIRIVVNNLEYYQDKMPLNFVETLLAQCQRLDYNPNFNTELEPIICELYKTKQQETLTYLAKKIENITLNPQQEVSMAASPNTAPKK
jgi:hypothetical protein